MLMSRQGARAMARVRARAALWAPAASRTFADKPAEVPPPVSDAFKEAFKKAAPTPQLPKFPSQFMKPRPAVPSTLPSKLTANFVLPYKTELDAKELLEEDPALKHFKSDKETVRRIKKFGDVLVIIVSAGCIYQIFDVTQKRTVERLGQTKS